MKKPKKGFDLIFEPNEELTVLAFDPASTNMGWAYLHRSKEGIYTLLESGNIDGRKINKNKEKRKIFKNAGNYCAILAIEDHVGELIKRINPDHIASESAFAHRLPQAYASLTLVINAIRRASDKVLNQDILLVAPMQSKRHVSTKAMADKDLMRKSILSFPTLKGLDLKKDPTYTEHEIDAIAHGVTAIDLRLKTA